jgi:hypothetical protein
MRGHRKDGSEFAVEIGLNPVVRDGYPAVLASVMDIYARKRAEESQRLELEATTILRDIGMMCVSRHNTATKCLETIRLADIFLERASWSSYRRSYAGRLWHGRDSAPHARPRPALINGRRLKVFPGIIDGLPERYLLMYGSR